MPAEPDISVMLMALLDGRSLPAGELAYRAHVSPQPASSHLVRHRYYALCSADVAQAIEALFVIAPLGHVHSLREGKSVKAHWVSRSPMRSQIAVLSRRVGIRL